MREKLTGPLAAALCLPLIIVGLAVPLRVALGLLFLSGAGYAYALGL
jgi:hypothetical protein